jgi:hypothetical protein
MIFDLPPAELPVATLVPRESSTRFAFDLRAWFVARWAWFRPRTVPMIVALAGMLAVIASGNYLRNYAQQTPERLQATSNVEPGTVVFRLSDAPGSTAAP